MRRAIVLLAGVCLVTCGKKEQPAPAATQTAPTTTTAPAATASAQTPATQQPATSLTSFGSGALVVQAPPECCAGWTALGAIDEYPDAGWASPENDIAPKTFVIEMPERSVLDRLEFDIAHTDGEKRATKDLMVEVSDTSPSAGFQKIAEVSLVDRQDKQSFPAAPQVPGRWVRLTLKNNQGAPDFLELMDFRGYGRQLTTTPFPNASGTYETDYGKFHLQQEGTSVTGCYEHGGGLLTGGIEGRVMKFTWREDGGPDDEGPALMVFTSDGQRMVGLWGNKGAEKLTNTWNGKKISSDVGACPHWSPKSGGAEKRMEDELAKLGRTRLYGINFDTDSDVIRAESKPTLDKVVGVLKTQPTWKLTIEGHTDSTGGDAHNQELSQKRAEAVKNYIVGAGIGGERLTAHGMGAGAPLASNDTPLGRAQNRRVELVKE
jgi:outer membrane protein OmpA-like peptidoglycan-associated protein